ncbi:pheganomycin family RiPP precursor [Streptomyces lavendulae]
MEREIVWTEIEESDLAAVVSASNVKDAPTVSSSNVKDR